jgi:hypothetical protein
VSPIDAADVEKELTTVRVRGKLTLTCSQNEAELGNVFKYLLEKVRLPTVRGRCCDHDFRQFSAKKLAFFSKTCVMI